MNTGLLITTGALLLVLTVGALLTAYLVRKRRRREEVRLSIAPRLQAWVGPPARKAPPQEQPLQTQIELPQSAEPETAQVEPDETPFSTAETLTAPPLAPADSPDPGTSPDEFEPLAPIELTVGDDRVALTEGTETHRRLREYADHLLGDLKAARRHSR